MPTIVPLHDYDTKCPEFRNDYIGLMTQQLLVETFSVIDKVLIKVLQELLGRVPEEKDFKKLTFILDSTDLVFYKKNLVLYDGVQIGTLMIGIGFPHPSVTFTPLKQFEPGGVVAVLHFLDDADKCCTK